MRSGLKNFFYSTEDVQVQYLGQPMARKKTNIHQIENYHNEGVRHLDEGCPKDVQWFIIICILVEGGLETILESHIDP